jgi:hypothetical protein
MMILLDLVISIIPLQRVHPHRTSIRVLESISFLSLSKYQASLNLASPLHSVRAPAVELHQNHGLYRYSLYSPSPFCELFHLLESTLKRSSVKATSALSTRSSQYFIGRGRVLFDQRPGIDTLRVRASHNRYHER